MIQLLILAVHLLATIAKLMRPGGVRAVVAGSLVLKHQLLISSRVSASWNLNRVLGFKMTVSLGIRLDGTNSDPRPRRKRSNEFRFGARRRARRLMSNWCFSNKDSATTARTPPGRTSLAMVANRWTARMSR